MCIHLQPQLYHGFRSFRQVYDQRYQPKYGFWRPVVDRSVTAFLKCGDLQQGFARVRYPDCHHEMFVAFSCKQRCTCPSCHQKRALLTAIHVADCGRRLPRARRRPLATLLAGTVTSWLAIPLESPRN